MVLNSGTVKIAVIIKPDVQILAIRPSRSARH